MPRPEAYPRMALPDSTYTLMEVNGVEFAVNEGAEVAVDGGWVTLTYSGVPEASVYLSVLKAADDSLPAMLANRRERMSLNLSGARAEMLEMVNPEGWQGEMVTSREAYSTPVQILAFRPGALVSGALYLQLPPTVTADSIAPVIETGRRDMLTLLKSLK